MKNSEENYYTGTIIEVIDPVLYEIKVDIPGIVQGVTAYPMRGEIDEPRVGDFVILLCLDPIFQSYYLYKKIKENDFIGFRSNGKLIDVTPDAITIGIFDPETEYNDNSENYRPELTDWVKIDSEGNIDINTRTNFNINIKGNSSISIEGDSTLKIKGNSNITAEGNTVLSSKEVTITGGTLKVKGTSSTNMTGPFNCIPTCPFSGAPHSGDTVTGT